MLSRLSAARSTALLKQIIRPCVVASTAPSRNFSLSTPVDNKHAWYNTAWPSYKMYKEMAGQCSGTVMGIGLVVYLVQKEIYVINEETYLLAIMLITAYNLSKVGSNHISAYLDKERKAALDEMNSEKEARLAAFEEGIVALTEEDEALKNRDEMFDIAYNREELKLELEYRRRLHEVESEVKKRLDYQVELQNLEQGIEEKHIATWVEQEVLKSITEEQEEDALLQCIRDLNGLADAKAVA